MGLEIKSSLLREVFLICKQLTNNIQNLFKGSRKL